MNSPGEVVVHADVTNEQVVIAAAMADAGVRAQLTRRLSADLFQHEKHRGAWEAVQEVQRRGLAWDLAAVQQMLGGSVDVSYLAQLAQVRPDVPPNLDYHVESLLWDAARLSAVRGPIASLLESVRDPKQAPERTKALARQVVDALGGHHDRRFLRDPAQLVAEQVKDIRARMGGRAVFAYGIPGLDDYEDGRHRLVPGAAPGKVTVLTGLSGSGKSTVAAEIALAQARMKRRVLYGAWEMGDGMTIELLACKSLRMSRTALMTGALDEARLQELQDRMHRISRYVSFMANPFWRSKGEKGSNERNLDLVHQHVADSGADIAIFDLWERCLASDDPGDEKRALFRQQAMAEETKCHVVLLAQQRGKDLEQRADKRPTREGIKGSGAWTEIADTILGTHRQALFKDVPDDTLEIDVLKQRFGPWPLAVDLDWDPDLGMVSGGRSVSYDQPVATDEISVARGGRGKRGGK